ncbi:MAG: hypothetical protein AAF997_13235 [Myxococcota bacterium]
MKRFALTCVALAASFASTVNADRLPPADIDLSLQSIDYAPADARTTSHPGRDVRLTMGLAAVEGAAFTVVGLGMTAAAIKDGNCRDAGDLSNICIGPALLAFGLPSLAVGAFSIATLSIAVGERRRRLDSNADLARSNRVNRMAIAYDSVLTTFTGTVIGFAIATPISEGDKVGKAERGVIAGFTMWMGLHLWSLGTGVRALRGRKRNESGPRFNGAGLTW